MTEKNFSKKFYQNLSPEDSLKKIFLKKQDLRLNNFAEMDFTYLTSKNSVKNLIIVFLSAEWPLTARELFHRIKEKRRVSFQAIFKAIKQLHEQGVVLRQDNSYKLNTNWLEQMRVFSENMLRDYETYDVKKFAVTKLKKELRGDIKNRF